jgi:4-diphosphocytidyl-2-C-methyl-D-erythritol kinase
MPLVDDPGWSRWPAPAKLNLFLHITGRRADGYHLLQTVFQLLDWGDEVRARVRDDGRISCEPLAGVEPEANLGLRAAQLLQRASGTALGAELAIDKRIPLGGGLGGGSSDAATVLVALNELWGCGFDEEGLADLGRRLGADVPVFVRGKSAWAEGIGEVLTAMELPERWYVIVDPGVSVSTARLFGDPDLTRNAPRLTIPLFTSGVATENAFESLARAGYPQVAHALEWLGRHAPARLSGSGGCVFAAVETREAGEALVERCPRNLHAWLARGVDRSPLGACVTRWRAQHALGWAGPA